MIPGGLFHHIYTVPVWSKYRWEFSVMHLKIFLWKDYLLRSYDLGSVKFIIKKSIWFHAFHILVSAICMIRQIALCWDQINKIIWVAHLFQKLFQIISAIPISTVQDLPLHYYSMLEIRMWVISIHIYLICIFVVKGSRPSKDSKVSGKRDKWDFSLCLEWGDISARSKND